MRSLYPIAELAKPVLVYYGGASLMLLMVLYVSYVSGGVASLKAYGTLFLAVLWIVLVVPMGMAISGANQMGKRLAWLLVPALLFWLGSVMGFAWNQAIAHEFRHPPPRPLFHGDFDLYGRHQVPQWRLMGYADVEGTKLYVDAPDNMLLFLPSTERVLFEGSTIHDVTLRLEDVFTNLRFNASTLTVAANGIFHTFNLKQDSALHVRKKWAVDFEKGFQNVLEEMLDTDSRQEFQELMGYTGE